MYRAQKHSIGGSGTRFVFVSNAGPYTIPAQGSSHRISGLIVGARIMDGRLYIKYVRDIRKISLTRALLPDWFLPVWFLPVLV